MADSSFDRIKVALDSITMIDKLIEDANLPSGTLDPPNINEIIENNRKHLLNEKNKGGFNETQVELINTKVSEAATFIQNNPNNGGGGGVSPNVAFFQDCNAGFVFGLDFSPTEPNLKIGDVYALSSMGYKGCCQVITKPRTTPPIYTKPSISGNYGTCQECIDKS